MIVLPSNAWIHEVPAVIAALRSTATLAPVHVCLLLFCGQRLDDTAAKLCPLASMIISSISPGRSKDGQLQVCMPAWLDAPGDVLDVVAQLDGSLRKGCPHLALDMIVQAGASVGALPVSRTADISLAVPFDVTRRPGPGERVVPTVTVKAVTAAPLPVQVATLTTSSIYEFSPAQAQEPRRQTSSTLPLATELFMEDLACTNVAPAVAGVEDAVDPVVAKGAADPASVADAAITAITAAVAAGNAAVAAEHTVDPDPASAAAGAAEEADVDPASTAAALAEAAADEDFFSTVHGGANEWLFATYGSPKKRSTRAASSSAGDAAASSSAGDEYAKPSRARAARGRSADVPAKKPSTRARKAAS